MRLKQTQALVLLLAGLSIAGHASVPQLTDVKVTAKNGSTTVILRASGAFTHNEYSPTDNLLLVDLVGVSAGKLNDRSSTVNGPAVTSYHVLGYAGAGGVQIARVELSLKMHCDVRVNESREGLTVEITPPPGASQAPAPAAVRPASQPAEPSTAAQSLASSPGAVAPAASSPKPNPSKPVAVEDVKVFQGTKGTVTTVEISASGPLNPKAMRLAGPDRIVVDLPGAVSTGQSQTVNVHSNGVIAVRIGRFQASPPITRLVLDLDAACEFELANQGNKLSIYVRPASKAPPKQGPSAVPGGAASSSEPVVAETPAQQPKLTPASLTTAPTVNPLAMASAGSGSSAPILESKDPNSSSSASDQPAAVQPAPSSAKEAAATSTGTAAAAPSVGGNNTKQTEASAVASPTSPKPASEATPVQLSPAPGNSAALASGAAAVPPASLSSSQTVSPKQEAETQPQAGNSNVPAVQSAAATPSSGQIAATPPLGQAGGAATLNREPEYRGDSTPAQEFVVAQAKLQEHISDQDPNRGPAPAPAVPAPAQPPAETSTPATAAAPGAAPQQAVNFAAEQRQQAPPPSAKGNEYTGEPVSVNLKDVDLKDFFRLIHEISGLNIVLDPSVTGSLTLVLDDVPWDQALDIVLKNNGLDRQLEGNVLRIASRETLRSEAEARRKQDEAQVLAVSKITNTRFLSYAHAKDVMPTVKRLLSVRGEIVADERTNGLIISDIPSVFPAIDKILAQLDRKTQEVEIEARVVAATRNFARDIGFQLGLGWGNGPTAVGGAPAAGTSPNQIGYTNPPPYITSPIVPVQTNSSSTTSTAASIPLFSNLGATTVTSGLSLLNIGNAYRVDAILTASEQRGLLKILSRPRVITQNNIQAVVKQGSRVPITTLGQLGGPATVTYVEAVLRLTVTPQITVENTIFLSVDIENTTPDYSNEINGNPVFLTQQATTQVLVTDGGTVVIGGVLQTQNSLSIQQVPVLGSVPYLGNLFKHRAVSTSTQELLFFLTPRIVET